MLLPVECPMCDETVEGRDIEKLHDKEPPTRVARRQTAFDGAISSLLLMDNFAYIVKMPCCGAELITVN